MLRVTFELVPNGDENLKKTIGIIDVVNDATGNFGKANYNYKILKEKKVWKTGKIFGFPRNKLDAFDLVYQILRNVIGFRNY